MIREKECTPQNLMAEIESILSDKERYDAMVKALQNMSIPDCAERVCDIMESLVKK